MDARIVEFSEVLRQNGLKVAMSETLDAARAVTELGLDSRRFMLCTDDSHSATLVQDVVDRVAQPTVDEMRRRGTPFAGVLYVGLALTSRGLRVVEFNARFGDPETQVVLARLQSPLGSLLLAAATGTLDQVPPPRWSDDAAVTVVVAAAGMALALCSAFCHGYSMRL